ncbi:hypothetical protein FOCC_FOCC006222 [Frankliniella occidentalis]|nr:hypothetical protein FOCC_FOCC006222 [Frankliniella occidentalis]
MVRYTNEELADIHAIYGETRRNANAAAALYRERYPPRRHPAPATFRRVARRLAIDGVFHRPPVMPRPRNAQAEDVLEHFRENPHTSQRRAADALGMSKTTIQRILADEKFHPFKLVLNQGLRVGDPPRRMEYSQWLVDRPEPEAFAGRVLWSDECIFDNKANVNRHNMHYWSDVNPHWMRTVDFQDQWSINCWGGVLGEQVIGPHFFDGRLNGAGYLAFLQNDLPDLLAEVPLALRRDHWFQQDGAPPHWLLAVRAHLNQVYPQRWIGRDGPVAWPARSPDLTPPDFFLWGHVKNVVYETKPDTEEELRDRIEAAFRAVTPATLVRVQRQAVLRARHCIDVNGGLFEHLH